MTSPRNPDRDLRLDRIDDREGLRPLHLGEVGHVASSQTPGTSARDLRAAYQALIDAVFTAPGAADWLAGLRMKVAALIARMDSKKDEPTNPAVATDAIRLPDGDYRRA